MMEGVQINMLDQLWETPKILQGGEAEAEIVPLQRLLHMYVSLGYKVT